MTEKKDKRSFSATESDESFLRRQWARLSAARHKLDLDEQASLGILLGFTIRSLNEQVERDQWLRLAREMPEARPTSAEEQDGPLTQAEMQQAIQRAADGLRWPLPTFDPRAVEELLKVILTRYEQSEQGEGNAAWQDRLMVAAANVVNTARKL